MPGNIFNEGIRKFDKALIMVYHFRLTQLRSGYSEDWSSRSAPHGG
jgi:hypothetical protein